MSRPQTRSGLIAQNSILNFGGQLVPLIVGIASIPLIVKGLGVDSFGILSLAWMLLGYFTFFDLGLGRATTKFIAEEVHHGVTERLRSLFWTSCALNFLLGLAGGAIVVALASFLAGSVFRIPMGLVATAGQSFFILGMSLPIVLVSTALRGTLEAAQRFDYVNAVVIVASSFNFLLPLMGILLGFNVRDIVLSLMISRLAAASTYLVLCLKTFPMLKGGIFFDATLTKRLMSFGGWVSISNIVHPFLVYLDRFVIGSIISIAAVTYYTAPYEMVTRLLILPISLSMTLFPSFSAAGTIPKEELAYLFIRSVKLLLLLMGPLVMIVVLFAGEILRVWLGIEFAEKSTLVFQILAVGVLFNSPSNVPYVFLQGYGRPDLTAKFHLVELILYVPLVWLLVSHMGIVGGALAWTVRIILDALLTFSASGRLMDRRSPFEFGLKRSINVVALLMFVLCVLLFLHVSVVVKVVATVPILVLFGITSWRFVLNVAEKEFIILTTRRLARIARID